MVNLRRSRCCCRVLSLRWRFTSSFRSIHARRICSLSTLPRLVRPNSFFSKSERCGLRCDFVPLQFRFVSFRFRFRFGFVSVAVSVKTSSRTRQNEQLTRCRLGSILCRLYLRLCRQHSVLHGCEATCPFVSVATCPFPLQLAPFRCNLPPYLLCSS